MSDSDFIVSLGLPFLPHRLRRASELILEGLAPFLHENGFSGPARSRSTLLLLRREGSLSITEIAYRLRLTHPLIIKLVQGLADAGYVSEERDPKDNRRRLIRLTPPGLQQADALIELDEAVGHAFEELFEEIGADLLGAIERFEQATGARPIKARLEDAKKKRAEKAPNAPSKA